MDRQQESVSGELHAAVLVDEGRLEELAPEPEEPELKGSVGEGPSRTNYCDQSSVKICAKFRNFR